MKTINRYTRSDVFIGVGFLIEVGGLQQHSVAWSGGPAQQYLGDELERLGISFEPIMSIDNRGRALPPVTQTPMKMIEPEIMPAILQDTDQVSRAKKG